MSGRRLHSRLHRPEVEVDSPLIDCRLVNLSISGLAIETSVGLRLGVPYPFRLRHGDHTLSTEAEVRWCRLMRNEPTDMGDSRPVYRAGAAFVEWQTLGLEEAPTEVAPGDDSPVGSPVDSPVEAPDEAPDESAVESPVESPVEREIDLAIDRWIEGSRRPEQPAPPARTIIHHSPQRLAR